MRVHAEVRAAAAAAAADTTLPSSSTAAYGNPDSMLLLADKQRQQQKQQLLPLANPLSFATLNTLPVLNAVLWETLRFHPPGPGTLMRVAPRGGARVANAGGWRPAGTGVSAQVYTLQRNADAFPQPDEWRLARWLAKAMSPSVPLTSVAPCMSSLPSLT